MPLTFFTCKTHMRAKVHSTLIMFSTIVCKRLLSALKAWLSKVKLVAMELQLIQACVWLQINLKCTSIYRNVKE